MELLSKNTQDFHQKEVKVDPMTKVIEMLASRLDKIDQRLDSMEIAVNSVVSENKHDSPQK